MQKGASNTELKKSAPPDYDFGKDFFDSWKNFDKLSTFKLDVPDLDFPRLSKKIEKTHEKSSKEFVPGKMESKENKFSFDFDFDK
ncbi:hypothetical protein KSP39_PZI020109 [Platanthera zijinensis]|uniref:Uncharacterized protein n=1 Tax=Platanthera zijinensis TaxID=2320716 RepID=A0AAP0AZC5_9ASPA